MKTVEQVRRERLLLLIDEAGSLVNINKKLDFDVRDSTLSQIKNQSKSTSGTDPKVMGSKMARQLERAFRKVDGWMDTDPDLEWPFDRIAPARWRLLNDRQKGVVEDAAVKAMRELDNELAAVPALSRAPAIYRPQKRRAA